MELQFRREDISCMKNVLREVQELEQTQEVRLPEGMPEVGRILGAWGQPVLRSKEWRSGSIEITAGIQVWVLYIPESGEGLRRINSWIPFRMNWDLPEDCPDGTVRVRLLPRLTDSRPVSAGKILIRAGVAALAEAWCPRSESCWQAEGEQEGVELLKNVYPLRLPREAGEKQFTMEEQLSLPASAPQPERVVYFRMDPGIGEKKILTNKIVFRGGGNLHLVYESEDGQLHSWDFELPFSQYAELEGCFSTDAQADILPMVTNAELETDQEGRLHLNAGITAQYLVDDRVLAELTEDAYSPHRSLELRQETLELPVVLDSRRENLYGEAQIPGQADLAAEVSVLPDFPRMKRSGETVTVELPATAQILFYDATGALQSATHRMTLTAPIQADQSALLSGVPLPMREPQLLPGAGEMTLRMEVPVQLTAAAARGLPMVTGVTFGEVREMDPQRPSLILRRAGKESLWDLAKQSGSTVTAIRTANDLKEDPEAGRMLLIPVI